MMVHGSRGFSFVFSISFKVEISSFTSLPFSGPSMTHDSWHEFEPLPHAEGHSEGEHGEDGVDIAEASKNDVSQLLHNAF